MLNFCFSFAMERLVESNITLSNHILQTNNVLVQALAQANKDLKEAMMEANKNLKDANDKLYNLAMSGIQGNSILNGPSPFLFFGGRRKLKNFASNAFSFFYRGAGNLRLDCEELNLLLLSFITLIFRTEPTAACKF